MKKGFFFLSIAAAIILFPGCKKLCDYVIEHPDADLKECPIKRIISTPCCDESDTLIFSYNSWGDPVSALRTPLVKTGHPNYFFKYDSRHRLTDMIAAYSNGTAEMWCRYFYDSPYSNTIARDSIYIFPTISGGFPETPYASGRTFYIYDIQGRIIKDSTLRSDVGSPIVNNYAYDAAGNRIGRSYDTKLNVHRTNKIWMFFDRDYSINNPFIADAYNSKGLPTSINTPSDGGYLDFLLETTHRAEITYGCK
jgi:hypothetical protein